ncbi:unnamed protein product [Sphenostylis stenocarpa]|uniref:Uncharacterized protein n=1 Tax=Sphenostylis stenocarpa TaxID=92480 RepID=A0AA86V8I7_9FABA|nr:unnamed protein product [Sphenostylis stenocarpa]
MAIKVASVLPRQTLLYISPSFSCGAMGKRIFMPFSHHCCLSGEKKKPNKNLKLITGLQDIRETCPTKEMRCGKISKHSDGGIEYPGESLKQVPQIEERKKKVFD